jgi:hypothetical protein
MYKISPFFKLIDFIALGEMKKAHICAFSSYNGALLASFLPGKPSFLSLL